MAARAAAAQRPVHVDRQVAELAGDPIRAGQQPTAGEDRAADAGRDGQVDEVVRALPGPEAASPRIATFVSFSSAQGTPKRSPSVGRAGSPTTRLAGSVGR